MPDTSVSCPNCGYGFGALRNSTRMFDCPSCDTTLFRDGVALEPLGDHGEMHDYPMLFRLQDTITVAGVKYMVVGHARYDYGRGTWEEMWVEPDTGEGAWVSIDEGDVAMQFPYHGNSGPRRSDPPAMGEAFSYGGTDYVVTEADTARVVAVRGEFPERIQVGDEHYFINAAGPSGQLLSGEFWEGGHQWHEGEWLDPFWLKVTRADGAGGARGR